MPFTFSHPAAVLPLTNLPKRWISMTGLIIGSIAPDFEYFLRMRIYSKFSHTWTGLFWFDLPLSIILAFVFHLIVRDSLIDHLPNFLSSRFASFKNFKWIHYFKANFWIIAISILFGTSTHIFWDGFTHENGQFVRAFDVFKHPIIINGYSIRFFNLLQHLSTIFGGLIILYALLQLPKDKSFKKKKSILGFWALIGSIALAIVLLRIFTGMEFKQYGNIVVTTISGGLIGLIVASKLTRT